MKGRHRSRRSSGRGLRIGAAVVAVVVVLAGSWYGFRHVAKPGCASPTRITVGAAPVLVTPLQQQVADWAAKAKVSGNCVGVDVSAADPADMAAAIAGANSAALGVGQASGKTRVPGVWIPDSTTWVQRLAAAKPVGLPKATPSVATSPIVLAVPEPLLAAFGGGQARLTWSDLLKQVTSATNLHIGIVDPSRDASGLEGLIALSAAAQASPGGQQASVAALRALASGRSVLRDELLRKFPTGGDPASLSTGLSLAPLPEQAVVAYDAAQPPVRLAPLYVNPLPASLDYPFVDLTSAGDTKSQVAAALLANLGTDAFHDRLAVAGLRDAGGNPGHGFALPAGAPQTLPAAQPRNAAALGQLLSTWQAITLPSRMLAVIDISGSMVTPVPSAGGATRMQVTIEAARQGMSLFDDSWAVGVWIFSTLLDGTKDYRELVKIGPLTSQRPQLLQALQQVKPKQNGNTGLYDTIVAAYKTVQDGWEDGRVNSLVVMTDGQNDDPGGPTLEATLTTLKGMVDKARPISVILIGIGTDVGVAEMKQITDVTGGGTFVAQDPAKIGDIFLQAIALRAPK